MLTFCLTRQQLLNVSPKLLKRYKTGASPFYLQYVLKHHQKTYKKHSPQIDLKETQWMKSLGGAKKESILDDEGQEILTVLRVDNLVGDELDSTSNNNNIYIRNFYDNLLISIQQNLRTVLIGNPGIGKSWFHYYYLARISRPDLFAPLTPDYYNQSVPPRVVIRQMSNQNILVYFIEEKKVHTINSTHSSILKCFDLISSLYLFEPGDSYKEPHYLKLSIPTLETVSPDTRRYKEFTKNDAMKLYSPVWTLPELLSLGKFIHDNDLFSRKMTKVDYSDDQIKKRYDEFGGILRYVFPNRLEKLNSVRKERDDEIKNADASYILSLKGNIESKKISHLLVQFKEVNAIEGNSAFTDTISDFVNQNITKQLEHQFARVDISEKALTLIKNDNCPSYMLQACGKIFETLICDLLQKKYNWYKKDFRKSTEGKWKEGQWEPLEDFAITNCIEGEVPQFDKMKSNTVYYSLSSIYPAVDIVFKHNNMLVCIQVTRQQSKGKVLEKSAFDSFLSQVDVKENQIRLVLCPRPGNANTGKIHFHYFAKSEPDYEVWRLPSYYTEGLKAVV